MKPSILVCGTGLVGLAAAVGLARAGLSVTLLGPRRDLPVFGPDTYCPRVYAISAASRSLLQELGVWGALDARRIVPVQAMDIAGDASGRVALDAWQGARDELAWILESTALERVLQHAVPMVGVTWVNESFESLRARQVRTSAGHVFTPDLLVGADGAASPVRTAAGISHSARPYGYSGVVTHLNCSLPHQGTAFQWFTGDAVLALLPMPDTAQGPQVSMVWSMPQSRAQELMALPPEARAAWLEPGLRAVTEGCLGELSVRSGVHAFPLSLERSGMALPGVALVGDAAHRVHPLAGQGLNLGLGDVQALIDCVAGRQSWRSPGDERVMARYRRARAEPVMRMALATDALHRLFMIDAPPVVMARNLGMACVNRLPFVKRLLIQGAAGSGLLRP